MLRCLSSLPRPLLRSVTAAAAAPSRLACASTSTATLTKRAYTDDRSSFIPKPVFSSYKLVKSKCALDISLIRPILKWNSLVAADRKYLSLKRVGGFRLVFASGDNRSFDWTAAQAITLNINELGDLLAFKDNSARDANVTEIKFIRDSSFFEQRADDNTNTNTTNTPNTKKELTVKKNGNKGYYFNFSVTILGGETAAESQPKKFSLFVSEGEFTVFTTLIQQLMPHLLAINYKPQIQAETNSNSATQE